MDSLDDNDFSMTNKVATAFRVGASKHTSISSRARDKSDRATVEQVGDTCVMLDIGVGAVGTLSLNQPTSQVSMRLQVICTAFSVRHLPTCAMLAAGTGSPHPAGPVQNAEPRRFHRDQWVCVYGEGGECVPCVSPRWVQPGS
jgi:hypothetical protein